MIGLGSISEMRENISMRWRDKALKRSVPEAFKKLSQSSPPTYNEINVFDENMQDVLYRFSIHSFLGSSIIDAEANCQHWKLQISHLYSIIKFNSRR